MLRGSLLNKADNNKGTSLNRACTVIDEIKSRGGKKEGKESDARVT